MAGYKVFQNGDILDANTDVNPFLMRQTVMVFDDAADRTAQLDGDELEGMVTYRKDAAHLERYDGNEWVSAAGLVEIVKFDANGTFTKASYPWLRAVKVTAVGGGGGGSGATTNDEGGAGGGGGGAAIAFLEADDLDATESVTIGTGGASAASATVAATAGGASSFGSLCVAGGGGGANSVGANFGGVSGVATTGDQLIRGHSGNSGGVGVGAVPGGNGGGSIFGGGGLGAPARAANVNGGGGNSNSGGGGAGGFRRGANVAGGSGGTGIVIVELYA